MKMKHTIAVACIFLMTAFLIPDAALSGTRQESEARQQSRARHEMTGSNTTYMLKPHESLPSADTSGFTKIFLAGTIDMGSSRDWQAEAFEYFSSLPGKYILFNPRQGNWDGSKPGEMDYQVNWELEHLEQADIIIMYIIGTSKSPITLLEMGLFARSGKLYVACEPDFYRHDNVRITCARYGVLLYDTIEEMLEEVRENVLEEVEAAAGKRD